MRLSILSISIALTLPSFAVAGPLLATSDTNWQGCYAGITAGGVVDGKSSKNNSVVVGTNVFAAQTNHTSFDGAIGGVDLGCNIQLSTNPTLSKFVFGPEIEGTLQNVDGRSDMPNLRSPGETIRSSIEGSLAEAVSFRLGYAFRNLLIYAKGGAAFTTFKNRGYIFDDMSGDVVDRTINTKRDSVGSLVGAGAEIALRHHWSAKLEYNYIDFGRTRTTYAINLDPGLPTVGFLQGPSDEKETESIVKGSLVYNF